MMPAQPLAHGGAPGRVSGNAGCDRILRVEERVKTRHQPSSYLSGICQNVESKANLFIYFFAFLLK